MYTFYTYHFVYEYTFCVFDVGAGTHSSMRRTTFSTTCYRFTTYHYGIYLFHFFIFFFFAGADTHSSMRRTTFSTTCYRFTTYHYRKICTPTRRCRRYWLPFDAASMREIAISFSLVIYTSFSSCIYAHTHVCVCEWVCVSGCV